MDVHGMSMAKSHRIIAKLWPKYSQILDLAKRCGGND